MARTTRPTAAQMALLCEMTMGGKVLHASDRSRRQGGHPVMRYTLCGEENVERVPAPVVTGLEARGLIERAISMPHEMSWRYYVTDAGRATVKAAIPTLESGVRAGDRWYAEGSGLLSS